MELCVHLWQDYVALGKVHLSHTEAALDQIYFGLAVSMWKYITVSVIVGVCMKEPFQTAELPVN